MDIETKDAHFFSGPRTKLAARTYLPRKDRALGVGVVMCHGFGGVKEGVLPSLAKELASAGYTAMTFDFRGFGGSEGVPGRLVPAEQAEDAVAALEFMAAAGDVDPERIALYGTSFGGGVAALAATMSSRPRVLAISVPVTSGSDWLASMTRYYELIDLKARAMQALARKVKTGEFEMVDRFDIMIPDDLTRERYQLKIPMTLETVYHLLHHEPAAHAHKITVPTLVFGVKTDRLVPVRQTTELYERLAVEKDLRLFDWGTHWAVYDELLAPVAKGTIEWFDRHLTVERVAR